MSPQYIEECMVKEIILKEFYIVLPHTWQTLVSRLTCLEIDGNQDNYEFLVNQNIHLTGLISQSSHSRVPIYSYLSMLKAAYK